MSRSMSRSIPRSYRPNNVNDMYEGTDSVSLKDMISSIKTNEWTILYSPWCGYSKSALQLLKSNKISHQAIDIENIHGSIVEIRTALSRDKTIEFPYDYSTRPMIFHNGKWLGGFTELKEYLG